MSSQPANNKTVERLKKIDEAIVNLKRGKNKLSIAQIAKKAGISRKTIYNHAELKERCDQAIHVQELEQSSKKPNAKKQITEKKKRKKKKQKKNKNKKTKNKKKKKKKKKKKNKRKIKKRTRKKRKVIRKQQTTCFRKR